ncbi:helix-turn-helix domain-containing protein [Solidesulfovibrio sp.]|uniref:helix-turn-helix domain-containing protein n=1 Tax=Solidesulfovibrio sp. TaxID=2910990 RepID=UPI002B1E94AD|nr:helix-turn-helix domain-containing protein [Solidesulfovibrio sp.]MEA4856154.1 helix-turn-helix domain-containing protein [Solidesulfovibrio sp.]
MDNDKRLVWTVEEVAERLGIGLSTAYEVVNAGTIRARQINRKWLIPKAALSEYLDGRDNPARVLSMDEVAEALGVHRNTVSAMLNEGTIRAVRAGRTWKIPLTALEEYLAGRDNPPAKEETYEE